ncbi:MAG: saccharopine dehydrogenase NADP-binding domain-containing protein, partial [Firmicutes bacterium]|nr:saccharopine dehydrogenase NADP-binding domain-containing protein [Bacillota bacterium]
MESSQRSKVMVIGAGGVGRVVVQGLARLPYLTEIIIADIDGMRAQMVAQASRDRRVVARAVDAGNQQEVAAAADGCRIVIHAGIPRLNFSVMEACLQVGAHYIDMASDGPVPLPGLVTVQEQMARYHDAFRAQGLLALLGIGSDPGVSNILARWAYDTLHTVESLVIYDGDNSASQDGVFALPFSPDTSIEECLQPPLTFSGGEFVLGAALETGIEVFHFPDPIGPLVTRSVAHEEVGTLPLFLGGKGLQRCEFKYALSDEYVTILKVLHTLGLDREDLVPLGGISVSPRKLVASLLPSPSDLGNAFEGSSCVGVKVQGMKADGTAVEWFLYT